MEACGKMNNNAPKSTKKQKQVKMAGGGTAGVSGAVAACRYGRLGKGSAGSAVSPQAFYSRSLEFGSCGFIKIAYYFFLNCIATNTERPSMTSLAEDFCLLPV